MEITKINTVVTHIKRINARDFTNSLGKNSTIITLTTEDGYFSNFASVWERQNIDVKQLSEKDPVEIEYTIFVNPKTKHEYKNFTFVQLVEPKLNEQAIDEIVDELTADEETSDQQTSDKSMLTEIVKELKDL